MLRFIIIVLVIFSLGFFLIIVDLVGFFGFEWLERIYIVRFVGSFFREVVWRICVCRDICLRIFLVGLFFVIVVCGVYILLRVFVFLESFFILLVVRFERFKLEGNLRIFLMMILLIMI